MADFHRSGPAPSKDLPVQDKPAANPRADRHKQDRVESFSGAETGLGECRGVGVIVQHGGASESVVEPLHQREIIPPSHLMACDDCSTIRIDRTAETDGRAGNLTAGQPRMRQELIDSVNDLLLDSLCALRSLDGGSPDSAARLALAAADRDLKLRAADFNAEVPAHRIASIALEDARCDLPAAV